VFRKPSFIHKEYDKSTEFPKIFSACVQFHFGSPTLRSVMPGGKASRFETYSKDQPNSTEFPKIFSACVQFHFGSPTLRSVMTGGKASRFETYSKDQPMYFGCMNVILLYSDNRQVSATHTAICRVVSARLQTNL